jgi:hypothetical protein
VDAVRPARIEHLGVPLEIDVTDAERIEARAHGLGGVRLSATYLRARYKYPQAPEPAAMELAAAALGITAADLRARLPGAARPLLQPARVTVDAQTWSVEAHELEDLDQALCQGTWAIAALYPLLKARTGSIEPALALTAGLLGTTADRVRGSLEWYDQYMRWHDADESYTIF